MTKRSRAEIVLLILSGFTAITISPLMYLRWLDGDVFMAAVDAVIVLTMSAFFIFVYHTRKVNTAKVLLAIFLAIAIIAIVAIRGQSHLFGFTLA